jgi:hypothetical protein
MNPNTSDRRIRILREIMREYSENIRLNNQNVVEYSRTMRALVNLVSDSSAIDALTNIMQTQPEERPLLTALQVDDATQMVQYDCDVMNHTQCPITLEDFVDGEQVCRISHCGHIFKRTNLLRWFDTNTCCPVCRHNLLEQREDPPIPVPPTSPNPVPRETETEPEPVVDMDQISRILTQYVNEQARDLDASGNSSSIYTFRFPLSFRR